MPLWLDVDKMLKAICSIAGLSENDDSKFQSYHTQMLLLAMHSWSKLLTSFSDDTYFQNISD
jgi:hypothetical protein